LKGEKPQNKNRKTPNFSVKRRNMFVKYLGKKSKIMQACK
jgi:hypothetical protein